MSGVFDEHPIVGGWHAPWRRRLQAGIEYRVYLYDVYKPDGVWTNEAYMREALQWEEP